jgi:hypothetical protein
MGLGRDLRSVAVSTRGGSGGSESEIASRGESADHSEVIAVGCRGDTSEAGGATRRVSFGEEGGQGSENSGLSSTERASDLGAVEQAEQARTSNPCLIPPKEAPSISPSTTTSSTTVEASSCGSGSGIGDRIAHSQIERNLDEGEHPGSAKNWNASEGRFC